MKENVLSCDEHSMTPLQKQSLDELQSGRASLFQHQAFRAERPVIRIPRDVLSISRDEIQQTRTFSKLIYINDTEASVDRRGRVEINI
jgi:calcium permeable stress-gated cation channel